MVNKCSTSKGFVIYHLRLILNLPSLQQSLSLGINPVCNVEPCYPHDNIVDSHSCDESKTSNELSVSHRLWAIFCHESGSFDGTLTTASGERDPTLHTLEHCLPFLSSHLTQKGSNNPPVGIVTFHNQCDMPRSRLVERCLDVHARQVHCEHTTLPCFNMGLLSSCHSQCFCSKFVIITCKIWQLTPSIPPKCHFFQLSGSFSFSRRRITQDAYHFDITEVNAMAL